MTASKLRFAVVGCGRMGRRRMRLIADHSETELVCVADVNLDHARSAAEEYGCRYYQDYEQVLSTEEIDGLVVSVPNKWHRPTVIAALQAGKHVFCEKPLARNPDESRAMVEAELRAGVTLKAGSNLRYFPNVLKAKELLDQQAIGRLLFLRSWIGHEGWNLGDTWYGNNEIAGGGTLLDNGAHVFDLIRWFTGEVKSCLGVVQTSLWPVQPLEDNGYGLFEMLAGQVAFVHASWTEWVGYMYMEIYGTEGYIRVDSRGKTCLTILGDRRGEEEVFDFSALPPSSYPTEFEDYVRTLREGRHPVPSGYDALRAVQMAWGVYESSKTGRKIDIWCDSDQRLWSEYTQHNNS